MADVETAPEAATLMGEFDNLAFRADGTPTPETASAIDAMDGPTFGGAVTAMIKMDSICGSDDASEFQKIDDTLVLDAPQGTEHAHYFGHPKVAAKLVEFLTASRP